MQTSSISNAKGGANGQKPTVLVTGGAGYIGSHAVLALESAGYQAVILDNLEYGHKELAEQHLKAKVVVGDTTDRPLLDEIFSTINVVAVMHFAAYIAVGESVTEPAKYYRNNVYGTLNLLEAMVAAGVAADQIERAAGMYGEAVEGKIYGPYLDGYGFYKSAKAAFDGSAAAITTEASTYWNGLFNKYEIIILIPRPH